MTLYFTIVAAFVTHILTSTVTVLLWQCDKTTKAHTHFWQKACTETLRQGQNRLGLKEMNIGVQPLLKLEEKQMVRVAHCLCKASEQCHCKIPKMQSTPMHPYRHRPNLKAISQPLYGGSGSP